MPSVAEIRSKGEPGRIALRNLRLDSDNPRLSPNEQRMTQADLAVELEIGFEALTVAESVASHGYFESEPLIVIADSSPGIWIVVEGNRRLTALLGLADSQLRAQFPDAKEWEPLAEQANITLDDQIPVVMLSTRTEATPIIGFRHISGILAWEPWAQARYIARLVDEEGMTYGDVATMIGIDKTKVGNLYRDQAIVDHARALGIETGPVESAFSLMTVAMSTTKLRNFVGADLGSRTEPGIAPIPHSKAKELYEVITWVYGNGEVPPVISESRQISKLGNVVDSPAGLAALRRGEPLEVAEQAVKEADDDPRGGLLFKLRTARSAMTKALDVLPDYVDDDEVLQAVDEARAAVDALFAALDDA